MSKERIIPNRRFGLVDWLLSLVALLCTHGCSITYLIRCALLEERVPVLCEERVPVLCAHWFQYLSEWVVVDLSPGIMFSGCGSKWICRETS